MKKLLTATTFLFVLVAFAASAQAQTVEITQKPPTRGPGPGFDVLFSQLDPMSPMGTAIIRYRNGDEWVVRYLERDHQPGLSSPREILYRVRKL